MMELGELELTVVSDGEFRLDGGAMFGVVPRTLWEKAGAAGRPATASAWAPTACWWRAAATSC